MENNNLFASILDDSNKKRYQEFQIEMGIDKVNVIIPLKESNKFEKEVVKEAPNSRTRLKEIVTLYNGYIEEVS